MHRGIRGSSLIISCWMIAISALARSANSALVGTTRRSFLAMTYTTTSAPKYWNREESKPQSYPMEKTIVKKAKIVSLSNADDPANAPLHKGRLPEGTELLAIGSTLEDLDMEKLKREQPNVVFVSHPKVRRRFGLRKEKKIISFSCMNMKTSLLIIYPTGNVSDLGPRTTCRFDYSLTIY